jgi:hypothetical protein
MAFVWGDGGAQMTPEAIAAQRKIAQAMMQRGGDYSPIQSAWQGAARVAEGLMGGLDAKAADAAERRNATAEQALLASLMPGAAPAVAPAAAPVAAPAMAPVAAAPAGDAAAAIAAIESGGKYDKLGPVTKTGDRAYGKYQVMGANVPQWTRTHLGQEMTPDQFLASPEAQDAVFKGQFGQYAGKYGPEGAAKAWFAGERGMNNPNAKDQLGTSVQAYADKFTKGYGGASPAVQAVAQAMAPADPAALPANAQPAQGYAVPGQAAAPTGPNPRMVAAMASPYVSEGTKKVLGLMLQSQLSSEGVTTVDAGNKVIVMDKRGNVVKELAKGEPNKGASFVDGPPDPATGLPTKVWADPRDKSVVPYTPSAPANAAPSTIPPVPGGVDPKVWRETFSKNAAQGATPASFDDTSKLRNEISQLPSYKNMAQAAPIYKSMADAAGRNTKAADLNMVYGLGKIMDPGSVVREGEIQMANNAQGWQEKLNGIIGQINNEGGLTPAGRQALMAEAHSRIQSYKMMYDQDSDRYRGIATRNRANPEDVVHNFGEFQPWTAPKAGGPAEDQKRRNLECRVSADAQHRRSQSYGR